jgi:GTP1/Obg family GTP-binding protein
LLEQKDTRYPLLDIALNIVFALFSHQSDSVDDYRGSHPHPEIRSAYCNAGIVSYCSQPNQSQGIQAYKKWRTVPNLAKFYWEMHYVLSGPYHLKSYLANADALRGNMNQEIQELWEHSKPTWDVVSKHAIERQRHSESQ